MVYPLAVAAISVAFGLAVLRQYLRRRKPYQLVWAALPAPGKPQLASSPEQHFA